LLGENQNTYFVCSNYLFSKNHAICEIMWKNKLEPGRPQMTIWLMRTVCWMTTATDTHLEYVIVIPFLKATMVTRTGLKVASIGTLPVFFFMWISYVADRRTECLCCVPGVGYRLLAIPYEVQKVFVWRRRPSVC
jgi:hypothetical protein